MKDFTESLPKLSRRPSLSAMDIKHAAQRQLNLKQEIKQSQILKRKKKVQRSAPQLAPLTTSAAAEPFQESSAPYHHPPTGSNKYSVTSRVLQMQIGVSNSQEDELPQTVSVAESSPNRRHEENKNSVISKNLPGTNQQSRNMMLNRAGTNIKVVTGAAGSLLDREAPVTNATLDLKPRKVSFQAAMSVENQAEPF